MVRARVLMFDPENAEFRAEFMERTKRILHEERHDHEGSILKCFAPFAALVQETAAFGRAKGHQAVFTRNTSPLHTGFIRLRHSRRR
jgi:hypothetical protein